MTILEMCDMLDKCISSLNTETREEVWDWTFTKAQPDTAHVEDFSESIAKTRSHFGLEGDTSIWGVSTNPSNSWLAVCGNSPSAESRAQYLASLNPTNVKFMIDYIRAAEKAKS
jgi:hypothetical protein